MVIRRKITLKKTVICIRDNQIKIKGNPLLPTTGKQKWKRLITYSHILTLISSEVGIDRETYKFNRKFEGRNLCIK